MLILLHDILGSVYTVHVKFQPPNIAFNTSSKQLLLESIYFFLLQSFSLLPHWSPFGDFGPHFFFKVPIFSILGLSTRQKSVQPLSNVNHLITCDNKNWFQKLSIGPNGDYCPHLVPISVAEGPHVVPISLKMRSPF